MPILGAHMSIAGGYYRAVQIAADTGCDCVQLFTKNNNQWQGKAILESDVSLFQQTLAATGVKFPISHSSYLINLAAPESEIWQKSVDAMVVELQRATQLGIAYVVLHPGAHKESSEATGLARVVQALHEIDRQVPAEGAQILLETTAGQGTCLGWKFEQLAHMIQHAPAPDRLGVCFDTCHVFAAGYPLQDEAGYHDTLHQFDQLLGLSRIKAFHLNDSKKGLGSHVDRHEHIGQGQIGIDAFRWLLQDSRVAHVPMYLETPKGEAPKGETTEGESWDQVNLRTLRSLVSPGGKVGRNTPPQSVASQSVASQSAPTKSQPTTDKHTRSRRSTRRS